MRVSTFKIFVLFTISSFFGVYLAPKLSVHLNPTENLPSITVNFLWPNTSPYVLERKVTNVLEAGFNTVKGVTKISSKSSRGSGIIILKFDEHTNIDVVRFEIAVIIRQLYKQFPNEVSYPTIWINRPDDQNQRAFLTYSVDAPVTRNEIREVIKSQIEPFVSSLQDIDKVEVYGATNNEYVINYNENFLKRLEISKKQIVERLKEILSSQAISYVDYNSNYIILSIDNSENNIDWHLPIIKIAERIIYLDQIASIRKKPQKARNYYRINGKNALNISFFAKKNGNVIELSKEIYQILNDIKLSLPKNYNLKKSYDSSEFIISELKKIIKRAILTILALFFFILLINRSFKFLQIVVLCITTNICSAFLFYYVFNIEIQLYSLAGLTISLGLIVDNCIVMVDHLKNASDKRVLTPILASTFTTVCSLALIHVLDDDFKTRLNDFAYVIIINLSISLFVAYFLIPALSEKLDFTGYMGNKNGLKNINLFNNYENLISFQLKYRKWLIIIIILIFGLPVFLLPKELEQNDTWYQKAYNKTIGNDWFNKNIRPSLDKYLGGTSRLFAEYSLKNAYYTNNEETKIQIVASMDGSGTIEQMNEVILEIENYLEQFSQVKDYISNVQNSNYARIEISFKNTNDSIFFPFYLKTNLIRKVLELGGISWRIYGVGNGFNHSVNSNEPINFSIKARGYNYDDLNSWADSMKIELEKEPRIEEVYVREGDYFDKQPSYEYKINLNKELQSLFKANQGKIVDELRNNTIQEGQDLLFQNETEYIPIRFESNSSSTFDFWHIKHAPLNDLDNPIILNKSISIDKQREEESILRENQEYIRLIEFQYIGLARTGSLLLDEKLKSMKSKLPFGYTFEKSRRQWLLNKETGGDYIILLLLTICIIYLICSVLFESYAQPFIILSIVPISFIGVFLTFYLFDFNFDQGGLASFVLLAGITVNASILIVDEFNYQRRKYPNRQSILNYIEAFKMKFFPISATVLSTILGFMFFLIEGQNEAFWFALGVGVIGGLLFSFFGLIFYLPIFLLISKNERL